MERNQTESMSMLWKTVKSLFHMAAFPPKGIKRLS